VHLQQTSLCIVLKNDPQKLQIGFFNYMTFSVDDAFDFLSSGAQVVLNVGLGHLVIQMVNVVGESGFQRIIRLVQLQ
jgi:hypothetical protein